MGLSDGDPRRAAPDLYERLTGIERLLVDRAFAERLGFAGRNDPEYPDDAAPVVVATQLIGTAARRAAGWAALSAFGVFLALALLTIPFPGMKGPFMLVMFLTAVSVSVVARVLAWTRGRQASRYLADHPPLATLPSTVGVPADLSGIGPAQMAPVLMERITRLERALAVSFFPGEGRVSTGTPDWNGSAADRLRLRRCFTASAVFVLVMVGFLLPLLVDALLSAALGTDDGNLSGGFVVGWILAVIWYVRRRGQIRRWYRSGVGREPELARGAVPDEAARPGAREATPKQKQIAVAIYGVAMVALLGGCTWGAISVLADRADTRPYPGGETAIGTVVRVEENVGRGTTYRAHSEFRDADGRVHRVTGQSGAEEPKVGDQVEVSYRASDPEDARELTTNVDAWKFPLATAAFGILVGLLGSVLMLLEFRKLRRS